VLLERGRPADQAGVVDEQEVLAQLHYIDEAGQSDGRERRVGLALHDIVRHVNRGRHG